MTKEEYVSNVYIGKHEKHKYKVWRVLGPGGPQEEIIVNGKEELKDSIAHTWDYEITDLTTGEVVDFL